MNATIELRKRKGNNTVRTEHELASDLLSICEFRKKGFDWRRIARELNAANGLDLNFVVYFRQYKNSVSNIEYDAKAEKDELIADEIAGIDWQIEELTVAWEASKGLQMRSTVGERGSNTTEWTDHGDPRYMAEITKLRERRAKILGIDAAEKKDINLKTEFADLTDEQLSERLKRIKDVV